MSKYSKGDKIKIDISFYKDMKQPYKYINPFSIITSVNEYESKNHGENHGDR